jgi:acyl dehydratase
VRVISSIEEAVEAVGQELGVSQWVAVDQDRINAFAHATGDRQWIHVDVERARTESPYGTTIAHGFLTLSLIPALSKENYRIDNAKMGINYGLNRVRFMAPVPAGGRIRLRSELVDAAKVGDTTVDLTVRQTVELDGSTKPAAVAEVIARMVY